MSDIIIDDAEFLFAENVLYTYLDNLTEACCSMIALLDLADDTAIQDFDICAVLAARQQDVWDIKNALYDVCNAVDGSARAYIADIDEIDTFIY